MLSSDQMSHTTQLALLSSGFDVIDHIWNLNLLLPTTDVSCGSLVSFGKGWDLSPLGFYREGPQALGFLGDQPIEGLKRDFKALRLLICLSTSETSEWQQYYEFKKKPSGQQDGSKVSAPKSDELSSVHSGTQGGKRELSPMELPSGLRMCTKACMCLCMRTHTIIITHNLFKIEKQNILFLFGLIFSLGRGIFRDYSGLNTLPAPKFMST